MTRGAGWGFWWVLAGVAAAGLALEVPYLTGRVMDQADMLPAATEEALTENLAALEERTGAQIAVLTVPSLEGEVLEDYALRVAETWELGRQGVDDGVLFLVARDDRKMRIEVGYGLEASIPDVTAKRILDELVTPRFRAGDFAGGISAGVDALITAVEGGDPLPPPGPGSDAGAIPALVRILGSLFVFLVLVPFVLTALFSKGCQSWFLWIFLVPFLGAFPSALLTPWVGVPLVLAWLVGFPFFKIWLAKSPTGKAFEAKHPKMFTWATSSGGGGWSGGGGGGFSGGGGSFGGGGASGSW